MWVSSSVFLSTLSLRRATSQAGPVLPAGCHFYPRSPCGERRVLCVSPPPFYRISIHALLAESDLKLAQTSLMEYISIHALLAESDPGKIRIFNDILNFYPRSPCGERLCQIFRAGPGPKDFYPRSPCGERRVHYDNYNLHCVISIHALLAESDWQLLPY